MSQEFNPAVHSAAKPGVLAVLAALIAAIALVIVAGRSSLFVPHAWWNVARSVLWLVVSALALAALAIRIHYMSEPKASFSKHGVLFVVVAAGLGFLSQLFLSSAAALVNPIAAEPRNQCFVLASLLPNASGNVQRLMSASVRLPGETGPASRLIRYAPGSVDLSLLVAGDTFELKVLDGVFGFSALDGQRPTPGCTVEPQVR